MDKFYISEYEETDRVVQIAQIIDDSDRKFKNPQVGRIYSIEGIAPTINTCQGGGREPKILEIINRK